VGKAIADTVSAPEVIQHMLSSMDEKGSNSQEKQQQNREEEWETVVWKDEGLNCALGKHSCRGVVDQRLRGFKEMFSPFSAAETCRKGDKSQASVLLHSTGSGSNLHSPPCSSTMSKALCSLLPGW